MAKPCTKCWIALALLAAGNVAFFAWGIHARRSFKAERSRLYAVIDDARASEAEAASKAELSAGYAQAAAESIGEKDSLIAQLQADIDATPVPAAIRTHAYVKKVVRQNDVLKAEVAGLKIERGHLYDVIEYKDQQIFQLQTIDDTHETIVKKTIKQLKWEKAKKGLAIGGTAVAAGAAGYFIARETT